MAEKTFRSPNFFETEIDASTSTQITPFGTPAAFIGSSEKGPAFVPVTVANFDEFKTVFGDTSPGKPATYAVEKFLDNRNSAMFMRVLGAGANETLDDITTTEISGTVKNAGFKLNTNSFDGGIRFISALHIVQANEDIGDRSFTDNDSITKTANNLTYASLIRAVVLLPNHISMSLFSSSTDIDSVHLNNTGAVYSRCSSDNEVIVTFRSTSSSFGLDNGIAGLKTFNVSFDPTSTKYVGNVLNTDPSKFNESGHLLYMHFPVEPNAAKILSGAGDFDTHAVSRQPEFALLSGSISETNSLGLSYLNAYNRFDTRFTFAKTTKYISQPFGNREHELFHFESIHDGAVGNNSVKITISDLRMSLLETNKYGTFTVQIRDINDDDSNKTILEEFKDCDLNPNSPNYIARKIGDRRVTFSFDSQDRSERRLVASGKYINNSKYVRVITTNEVENKLVPETCLPFGFKGLQSFNLGTTSNSDTSAAGSKFATLAPSFITGSAADEVETVSGSIKNMFRTAVLPPVPMRFKITRGELTSSLGGSEFQGTPSTKERVNSSLCWGVKFERTENPLSPNASLKQNSIFESLTKFYGIDKLEVTMTGSNADQVNNNKFSLSKVTLAFQTLDALTGSSLSVQDQMKSAVYVRNGIPSQSESYKISDQNSNTKLITLATLTSNPNVFNQYSLYTKFNNIIGGGFDGLNILDKNCAKINDKATSQESGGCAEESYISDGLGQISGVGPENNNYNSVKIASEIMTDSLLVNHNLLFVPDIKESTLTDFVMTRVKKNGMTMYVMDIPSYDGSLNRLFEDSVKKPDVEKTIKKFQTRFIDNNFAAAYFPDILVDDTNLKKRVKLPASVAAAGAMGFNDKISFAWFAPAGFNRASLDFVKNVSTRLNVEDRNKLYEARINPIAVFPRQGFVIYGQKTLQIAKSALDRVNVRRLMIEIKRSIVNIANGLVFETNNAQTRSKFVTSASLVLSNIQAQSGIERFQIVMDETNNSPSEIEQQKLNGRIVVIPTRAVEFIAIDFIITPSGVQFI